MKLPAIVKNSVWNVSLVDGLQDGKYRLLWMNHESGYLILYMLSGTELSGRPVLFEWTTFSFGISDGHIKESTFQLPPHILRNEDSIKQEYIEKRNKKFEQIRELVRDEDFLIKMATSKRVRGIKEHALKQGVTAKTLLNSLNLYWRYGQTEQALLPAYANCGGLGKQKIRNEKPMGSPPRNRLLTTRVATSYVIMNDDKEKIKKAISKHYLKVGGKTLRSTYNECLREHYPAEIKRAMALNEKPRVPSYRQFVYWKQQLFDPITLIKQRTTKRDYLLNKRATLGSRFDKSLLIGNCFEIDATVADVHIVSTLSDNLILGRPIIYYVVDRASGMVVGLHVSLFYASWRSARQVLANTFLQKADYCKEFGIEIEESEWPACHIPTTLMCDNGEMIGLQPQKTVVPLMEMQFSPPYRPDFKSMVENKFGLVNDELLHNLIGTTNGRQRVRGEKDPRKDACYTLKELTEKLIQATLELNKRAMDSLAKSNPLFIKHDVQPTPLNYWKLGIQNHKHALQRADKNEIIAHFYPEAEVSMTNNGIEYNQLFYSCERVVKEELASIARTNGRWKLEARINENTTNYIYVRFGKNEGFTRCDLLSRSQMFENIPTEDVNVYHDWRKEKSDLEPISTSSIDVSKNHASIEKEAKKRAKENTLAYGQRSKHIRENRQNELANTSNVIVNDSPEAKDANNSPVIKKPVTLPRRPKKR